jgi:hypothetical protein
MPNEKVFGGSLHFMLVECRGGVVIYRWIVCIALWK